MSKEIKEMDTSGQAGRNFKVDVDDINKVQTSLKTIAEPGDSVQLVDESTGDDPVKKAFIAGLIEGNSSIEGTFVVVDGRLSNSDIAEKAWQHFVGGNVQEDNDELPEIPDEERMERGDEYGVPVREDFDKIMEELKKSNGPTIKLEENIKPRIKKSDLISYIKNKK